MHPQSLCDHFEQLSRVTVWQALEQSATRLPDKVAVIDGEETLTYRDLLGGSRALADKLAALGLRKGSVAAVYMPNSLELYLLFYALQKLGVIVAWLNPNYRVAEARFIVENSGAQTLFLFEQWQGYPYLEAACGIEGLENLRAIVACGPHAAPEATDPRVHYLSRLAAAPSEAPDQGVGPDDVSMLIYTSGTTGRSKGATICQSQAVRAGFAYSLGVDATEDDRFLAFLPMSHSYGCGALLVQSVVLGSTVVILDAFSPEKAFALIEKHRVTVQLGAPAHYIMELKNARRGDFDLSSLRAGLIAGQIAPAQLITRVEEELGIYISSFLGSSEVGPGLSIILPYRSPLDVREECIGFPLPGTRAKVVDPATGEEKEIGEPGELLLSGWHVTQGYWRNPGETAHQIRDGWLHTGDLVSVDAHGCYRILGRLKDWINRGGFKIVPSEIEGYLAQYPGMLEVCVVGTPNPVLGESICVCARLDEGAEPVSLAQLRAFLDGKIAPYKLPDELLIVQDFPRLSGGLKLKRFGDGGVVGLAATATDKQVYSRQATATALGGSR